MASLRWLVTGAGGQLGRAFLAQARANGASAVGFGHGELDVADADAVKRALDRVQPDVVLNCAAFTAVDRCESEIALAERANALAPGLLARACSGGALLVHVSTDYVFDGSASRPLAEDAPTRPLSVYGRTKLQGEDAVRAAGGEHLIARTQWVFGAGANFVRTILRAAGQGNPLRVVEDQTGRPTWAGSLAQGLAAAVAAGARGTLHLANEGVASFFDLACAAVEEGARRGLCPRVPVNAIASSEMPRPAARPAYAVLGLARARALGVTLPHWRDALASHLDAEREGRDA
ncbi:MAG TPA: dTDP-4-dehydrorhamnose reductase [Myxococcota bacterium]|nr:dTDP-4-dehydrorhamnose reductase [Myxococcota bacterium]